MAISKLSLYNNALLLIGERPLTTDTDAVESRYRLDTVYDQNAVDFCLEVAKPQFALRTVTETNDGTTTEHVLNKKFTMPADYIALHSVYADGSIDRETNRYLLENKALFAATTTLTYRYVSNATAIASWTASFANVVSAYLAKEIAARFAPQKLTGITELFAARVQIVIEIESIKEKKPIPKLATFTLTDDYRNIYNGALNLMGLEQIVSNDDDSERRTALDTVLNSDAVNYLYELAQPRFALETNKLTTSVVSTEHDLDNVFTLPADYLSMVEVHADPLMDEPITRYIIEGRTIACNYSTIYIRFVSSSPTSASWTPAFKQLLSAYMAEQVKHRYIETELKLAGISAAFTSRLAFIQQQEQAKEAGKRSSRSTATLSDAWRKVYNNALLLLGLDQIVSNDDDSDRRSKLDVALGTGVVETVMEDLSWTFGITSNKLNYNPSLEPEWGFSRVFDKPTDLHRIDGLFQDEYFNTPLKDYEDEGDRWYCDVDEIYVKYVKTSYLTNPSSWPQYFSNIVAAELACRVGPALPGANIKHALDMKQTRQREAESTDAMSGPPQRIKTGSWVRSRVGNRGNSYNGRP